jgi:hypothetical protein
MFAEPRLRRWPDDATVVALGREVVPLCCPVGTALAIDPGDPRSRRVTQRFGRSETMVQKSLEQRVESLELIVSGLATLPAQFAVLSTQFVQLRSEVREEVSGIRGEMGQLRDEVRGEMGLLRDELRGEMGQLRDELRGEMRQMEGRLRGEMGELGDALRSEFRAEIQASEARLGTQMRVLHEEVLERITWLGDGIARARRSRKGR